MLAGLTLTFLSLLSMYSAKFQFWPPPETPSWPSTLFWFLFRVLILGIIALSVIDCQGMGGVGKFRFITGLSLMTVGFSAAFYASLYLGWRNAHGESLGLKTQGWYRWSRNPIYLVSLVGIAKRMITERL